MRYMTALLRGLFCLLALIISALSSPRVQAFDYQYYLDAKQTYLLTSVSDSGAAGSFLIRLSDLGLAPGDIIQLQPLGIIDYCTTPVPCPSQTSLTGAFTSDENPPTLRDPTLTSNVIPAGAPVVTQPTGVGNFLTDIVGDFRIPAGGLTVVTIPPGAKGLWVGVDDSYFSDNSTDMTVGSSNRARLDVTKGCPAPTVPAPAGAPFVCIAPGFTQELYSTGPQFFGGVAFAPNGDLLVNACDNLYFEGEPMSLRRFDAHATALLHGSSVHPQVLGSPFPSRVGCGMLNDLSGNVYSNTADLCLSPGCKNGGTVTDPGGVRQLDPATGAVLAGPLGGAGNGLGIARDPQTGNLVFVGRNSQILFVSPDGASAGVFSTATEDDSLAKTIDGIFFEPNGNFLFLSQYPQTLVVMSRDGTIVQNISVPGQPDGVAFHKAAPKFVVTNNTDGTLTRFDFPGDDYTKVPTQTLLAAGGFRGDIAQVGPDTCVYLPQQGTRFADGTISDVQDAGSDNSIVRLCPGFAPPTETTLTTVAGTGAQGFNGDTSTSTGHPIAVEAQLDFPIGVAADASGNVYFADQHNHRVRRVDIGTGFISTIAGTGVAGFNGDGILATGAELNLPNGVAVDNAGNLFIADLGNQRVRRVCLTSGGCSAIAGSPSIGFGVITTVAGTGNSGPAVNGGPATAANLFNPAGVAVNAGNLYIADSVNQQIRRVDSNGTITAFAGTGVAGFSDGSVATALLNAPLAVAVDPTGVVYIADEGNNRVRKVSGGIITTVAGNGTAGFSGDCGPATAAQLNAPSAVAVDGAGNVVIGDLGNNMVRRVEAGTITSLTLGGTLNTPYGVAVDATGDILVADLLSQQVKRIGSPTNGCAP